MPISAAVANRRAEGIEMWNSGLGWRPIAARLGVRPNTVGTWLAWGRRNGTYIRAIDYSTQHEAIVRMKAEGANNHQIAAALNRSARSVAVTICRMRKRGELPAVRR